MLDLCNEWSNLNPTQYGVERNSENCNYFPVSFTDNTSFQHPRRRQRQQVQVHFSTLRKFSAGGKRFLRGVLERMMRWNHCFTSWLKIPLKTTSKVLSDLFRWPYIQHLYRPDITKLLWYLLLSIQLAKVLKTKLRCDSFIMRVSFFLNTWWFLFLSRRKEPVTYY